VLFSRAVSQTSVRCRSCETVSTKRRGWGPGVGHSYDNAAEFVWPRVCGPGLVGQLIQCHSTSATCDVRRSDFSDTKRGRCGPRSRDLRLVRATLFQLS
jgi:hypothetical protein